MISPCQQSAVEICHCYTFTAWHWLKALALSRVALISFFCLLVSRAVLLVSLLLFLAHTADFIMQLTTVYTLVIVRYSIWKMSFTVWEYSLGNLLFSSTSVILIYVGVDIWIPASIPSNVELHFLKDLHLPISYRSISNKHHLYMYWKNFEERELASSFCLWVLSKEVFSHWRRIKFCALASHFVCVCSYFYFYKKNLKTSIYCFPSKLNLVLSVHPHHCLNVLIDHNYRLAMNMRVATCIPKETFC